jgi:YHS domain-containing protein
MNALFRFAVKGCLLTAVSGILLNQVVGLFAQDVGGIEGDSSAAPKIRRAADYQTGTAGPQYYGQQPTSEVQKQLQDLYRKNGREMPSMNIEDLPNVQPQAMPSPAASQYSSSTPPPSSDTRTSRTAAKSQKPNFFERLFRIGRARKQPSAVAQPSRPATPTAQPQRYATPQIAARPAAPSYSPPVSTVTPGPRATSQPPAREPAMLDGYGSPLAQTNRIPSDARRTPRSGISPPLSDDDEDDDDADSESLEMDRDEQPGGSEAPQILPNQTANGPVDSPYSGLRLSPLDEEQKLASSPKTDSTATEGADAASIASDGEPPEARQPAPLESAHDAAVVPDASPKSEDLDMKDEGDVDDDDDDATLTLPKDESDKPAEKPTAPEAEHPAKEIGPRPTPDADAEKPAIPSPMKGFRGYCPVALKDDRKLVEARLEFESEFHDRVYAFSTLEAKEAFDQNPRKYVPAAEGADVVRRMAGEKAVEGSLQHAAWYRGRLYLFSSPDSRRTFVDAPSKFVAED